MREIAEGPYDPDSLIVREGADQALEFLARNLVCVTVKAQRSLANALDGLEDLVALLAAHRLAENTAQ
jgi:hypothetical protein